MRKQIKTGVKVGLTAFIFMILPTIIMRLLNKFFLPSEVMNMLEPIVPLQSLVPLLMFLGLIRIGAIIARHFTSIKSPIQPVATTILAISGLYLLLWFLGLGNVTTMGFSERSLTSGPATVSLLIDLRFFAFLGVLVAVLKILIATLDFIKVRTEVVEQTKHVDVVHENKRDIEKTA